MNHQEQAARYPMLAEMLEGRKLPFQPSYTMRSAGEIFGVTGRAMLNRVAAGKLVARDLPGRARFLNQDLEAFLAASAKLEGQKQTTRKPQ